MDGLRQLDDVENVRIHRRILRDGFNPIEALDDIIFFKKFRFSKDSAMFIYRTIEDSMIVHRRGVYIPPMMQYLGALRFFATGTFQSVVGELFVVSQPSMSRIIKRVSLAIASRHKQFIRFPDRNACAAQKQKFMEIGGIPGIVGAIDCTHVKISSPGGANAEMYRNRKGYFSINVQAITDADLNFTNIIARWPGSVHDSRIFHSSRVCGQMENGHIQGVLLGDSGYALKPYLLTPLLNPQTAPERRYNYAHCRTRNIVERLFGVWKRRFACLCIGMRLKLETVLAVIVATAVLHNIARLHGADVDDDHDGDSDSSDDDDSDGAHEYMNDAQHQRKGVAVRNTIIHQHFTH